MLIYVRAVFKKKKNNARSVRAVFADTRQICSTTRKKLLIRCEQCFVKTACMQFSSFSAKNSETLLVHKRAVFSEIMYHFINYSNFCNI